MLLFGNPTPEALIAIIIAALIGMTVHEFAHNYVGHLMGDPVPAQQGRLTLDPRVHINWMGFAMFVLLGFGVLGSAPIAAYRMRNPRWGYLAAVAAGPFSNLLLAAIFAMIFRLVLPLVISGTLPVFVITLLQLIVVFNVLLFLFNLIPVFPLDGWYIVYALLPPDLARTWQGWQQYTTFVFFGLILLSFVPILPIDPLGLLIRAPLNGITQLLLGF